ncbi:hypothetical protein ACFFGV_00815 [Pontibacillus salicampi]|uniref:Metallo-beta-lactamase domain-containing protein n=1 Tax=Pontibacillus salicampi TaxID=1449801 RepID=A0ABV6LIC3_9BACI
MSKWMCTTCGVQYAAPETKPDSCLICTEERQFVNPNGQQWTTHEKIVESGAYQNIISQEEENLYSITTSPKFGIGQTAYLIRENDCNILWDCISYLDEETIQAIQELGGIDVIALSHPHYYSRQVDWAETFGATIYIHQDDAEWIMEPSQHIKLWEGEQLVIHHNVTLHRLGGHFKGGAVLLWRSGNHGKGTLLTGDIIQVVADTNWVSFMYSYPNLIPLPAFKVKEIAKKVEDLPFNRLYNAFHKVVQVDADLAVQRSAQRYIEALEGNLFQT